MATTSERVLRSLTTTRVCAGEAPRPKGGEVALRAERQQGRRAGQAEIGDERRQMGEDARPTAEQQRAECRALAPAGAQRQKAPGDMAAPCQRHEPGHALDALADRPAHVGGQNVDRMAARGEGAGQPLRVALHATAVEGPNENGQTPLLPVHQPALRRCRSGAATAVSTSR
ncbi:MAG: hypothetical protein R3C69_17155 [Geminicoccaceae bacterium]